MAPKALLCLLDAHPVIAFRPCFQSLGNHWLRYPQRAPSWADENVPESLSYQWGRRPLPRQEGFCVCCSRLCSHKLPQVLPPPLHPLSPSPHSSLPPSFTLLSPPPDDGVELEGGGVQGAVNILGTTEGISLPA